MPERFGTGMATFGVRVSWDLLDRGEHTDDDDMEEDAAELVERVQDRIMDTLYGREDEVGPNSTRSYEMTYVLQDALTSEDWAAITKALRYVLNDTYFDLDERNAFKKALDALAYAV